MNEDVRILIVEDNADDEHLLLRQLRKTELAKYVTVIRDGKAALDFLSTPGATDKLIAVFLDLHLPSLNGLEILAAIRDNETIRHLPVIVMTSSTAPTDLERCQALGVSHYVQKPISFLSFTKAVADHFHAFKPIPSLSYPSLAG
jgi:CheY-like chemotaxis protein